MMSLDESRIHVNALLKFLAAHWYTSRAGYETRASWNRSHVVQLLRDHTVN